MKQHQRTIGKNDEWITPKYIIDALGKFCLDPCAAKKMPWRTATKVFTISDNGLEKKWSGRVWLNPPFHRYKRPLWMKKMAIHRRGIMLIPAAFETVAFKEWVLDLADSVLVLNHRPHFCYIDGRRAKANSGCTICLVSYSKYDTLRLKNSDLGTLLKVSK